MSGMNFLEKLLDGVAVEWKALQEVAKIQRGRRLVKSELEEFGKYAVFQNCMTSLGYGEVPLTKLGIHDLDAYLDWRRSQKEELSLNGALFVSCSNRSRGKRLTYWGIRHVMDDLAEKTGIDLYSHRGRHTFATNLIVKYELDTSLAMELTRHRDVRSFRR